MTIEQRIFDWLVLNAPATVDALRAAFPEYDAESVRYAVWRLRRGGYLAIRAAKPEYVVPPATPRPRDGRGGSHAA
jgi:hypothetical protein